MEIFIEDCKLNASYRIWMRDEIGEKNVNYSMGCDGKMIAETWEHCQTTQLNPLIELPRKTFELLVKSIVEYNEYNGIHTERTDTTKGRLIEKENHLNDMKQNNERLFDLLKLSIEKI
jgi:hypothetical protein